MKWMHWGLIGWTFLSGVNTALADQLPTARLTLQSQTITPSVPEQELLEELRVLLLPRYQINPSAPSPSPEVTFSLKMEAREPAPLLRLERHEPGARKLHTETCDAPCTPAQRTEILRTLLAFVEPDATVLLLPPEQSSLPIASVEAETIPPQPVIPERPPMRKASLTTAKTTASPQNRELEKETTPDAIRSTGAATSAQSPRAAVTSEVAAAQDAQAPAPPDPLEPFRRQLAERNYNRHIWQELRNQLMFFRQENKSLLQRELEPLRVKLQIDREGKVVGQEILKTSREPVFDRLVLSTAPQLRLAPPDETLVREPPYVVVVQISP